MTASFDANYAAEQLRRQRSPLRRAVKHFYLANTLREVTGSTLDFGCGAGQILERLPAGSLGVEVNPALVQDLRARGLDVCLAQPRDDRIDLSAFPAGRFRTLLLSHVLEHFDDAAGVLRKLLDEAAALRVERLVVVVPGWRGYLTDPTHRTFVDAALLDRHHLAAHAGYTLQRPRYFPLNFHLAGHLHPFNEAVFVWKGQPSGQRTGQ